MSVPPSHGFILSEIVMIMTRYYQRSKNTHGSLWLKRAVRGALLLCCLCAGLSCTKNTGQSAQDGWCSSVDAVAALVAAALADNDTAALAGLCITRDEYMAYVWPELEVSKIEQWKAHADFVWSQHKAKSDAGLRAIFGRWAGQRLTVGSVRFTKPLEEYTTFRLHLRPAIIVRDSTGSEQEAALFGAVIERAGVYKVFSYNYR